MQSSTFENTEQLKDAFCHVLDNIADNIILCQDDRVVEVNASALNWLGMDKSTLLSQSLQEVLGVGNYSQELVRKLELKDGVGFVISGRVKGEVTPMKIVVKAIADKLAQVSIEDLSQEHEPSIMGGNPCFDDSSCEEEVREQEKKFEALFNVSFNAYIIHSQGKIHEVNDMFVALFGYAKEEATSLDIFSSLFKSHEEYERYMKQRKADGRTCFVGQMKRKNGAIFDAEVVAKNERLGGENVRIVTIRDVSGLMETERHLHEKNQELVSRNRELQLISDEVVSSRNTFYKAIQEKQTFLNDIDLGDVIVYGKWNYRFEDHAFFWSEEVRGILGYDEDQQRMSFVEFINQVNTEDRDLIQSHFFDAVKHQNLFKVEFRFITANGMEKVLQGQAITEYDKDGKPSELIGTILDITERKQIENKLKRQKDHYMRLNEELIISRKKAEESEKLKTSFFANMSHEIRTPMNGILGFSGLLMEPELSEEERLEYSQVIVDSGKRLLHIVNDILDISKIESDTVKINKIDVAVNPLLDNLHSLFGQDEKIQSGKIQFRLEKAMEGNQCVLHTDQNRLSQILTNLLSNAVKFTSEGEIVFGYRLLGDALYFYVKDTGIGVPDDMRDIIFEPFRQVEGHIVKQHGGTGLGLSISKKLTELLGGKMTMESEEGEGTLFNFTLPYSPKTKVKKTAQPLTSQTELKEQIKDVCMLIAEDDEVNFLFYKAFLGTRLKLLRAVNGEEAIEMVIKHPEIDIVLMDVKMPVMDGLEATRKIKETHPDLPIITQTAYAMLEDKEEAFRSGANDYLTKPINRRELLEKVKALCLVDKKRY